MGQTGQRKPLKPFLGPVALGAIIALGIAAAMLAMMNARSPIGMLLGVPER
jgi:hypothetical protein